MVAPRSISVSEPLVESSYIVDAVGGDDDVNNLIIIIIFKILFIALEIKTYFRPVFDETCHCVTCLNLRPNRPSDNCV